MSRLSKLLSWLVVGGALFAALVLAWRHGFEKGTDFWMSVAFIVALCGIAVGELLSWHNAACSWHERRLGGVITWGVLGAVLTTGVLYTNFSSAASNNDAKHGVQKASFERSVDVGTAIKEQEAEVKRLQERIRMAPQRTPEAARIDQDKAKAHRWWETTEHCTKTFGPQTRTFCDAYRAAEADEAAGKAVKVEREELSVAMEKLETLRGQRSTVKQATTAENAANLLILARYAKVSVDEARQLDSMVVPFMVQCVLLLGGICMASEHYRGQPHRPWIDTRRWTAGLSRLVAAAKGQPSSLAESVATAQPHVMSVAEPGRGGMTLLNQTFTDARMAEAAAIAFGPLRQKQLAA